MAAMVLFTLCSCGKQTAAEDTIVLSAERMDFESGKDQVESLAVQCNGQWQLEGYSEGVKGWMEIDLQHGSGNATIHFKTIEFNPYDVRRMAVLNFVCGKAKATLVISQLPDYERSISLSENVLEFGRELATKTIEVNTAKEWSIDTEATPVPSWIKLSPSSGEGKTTVSISTIEENTELFTRTCKLDFRTDRVHAVTLTVSQESNLEISVSPATLEFSGNEAQTLSAVVTTNTDKFEWTLNGYTEDVKAWLDIDIVKASAFSQTVTFRTLGANATGKVLSAELAFAISEDVTATLQVAQAKKDAVKKVISWTGVSGTQTITAPQGAGYKAFPYTTGSDPSKSPSWTDGPDGEEFATGYFKITRNYVFAMDSSANVGETYTMELGPSSLDSSVKNFYGNLKIHGYTGYRTREAYIQTPAIKGYKLTGVKVLCGNAADKANSVTIGTDRAISTGSAVTAANVLEGKALLTLGKPTPVDVTLTTTEPNTSYYVFILQDRLITGYTFTYTEAE